MERKGVGGEYRARINRTRFRSDAAGYGNRRQLDEKTAVRLNSVLLNGFH